jgi:hypothetical protein
MMTSGTAIVEAGEKVVEAGWQTSRTPEQGRADIEFAPAGLSSEAPTAFRPMELVAAPCRLSPGLAEPDVSNISNGRHPPSQRLSHIAEVEVDLKLDVDVARYTVNDLGVINPLLVDGQPMAASFRDRAACASTPSTTARGSRHRSHMDYADAAGRRRRIRQREPPGAGQEQPALGAGLRR